MRKGRPKVQFSSDEAGEEFWQLYGEVEALRRKAMQVRASQLQARHPGLNITAPDRQIAAGELVLQLMREERDRLKNS